MSRFLTTNDLITSIKRRGQIPENQSTFSEQDFIDILNEEMEIGMVPFINSHHENYFLTQTTTALVASQSNYEIPYRAVGNKLQYLSYVDSSGNERPMQPIDVSEVHEFQDDAENNRFYYVKNNEIIIVPSVGSSVSGSIKFSYLLRPNELVKHSRAAKITAIDTDTGDVTVYGYNSTTGEFDANGTFPTVFTTSDTYDFIDFKSPHKSSAMDLSISAIDSSTKTLTFTASDLPSTLEVNDYVCLGGESIVAQIPSDLHTMLAQRAMRACIDALNDTEALQNANAKLAEMENRAQHTINNRVEKAPKKIVNGNTMLGNTKKYYNRGW